MANAGQVVISRAARVRWPQRITAAVPKQGKRVVTQKGEAALRTIMLATTVSSPRHEIVSDMADDLRALSNNTTEPPIANSKIRNGIRKNTASGFCALQAIAAQKDMLAIEAIANNSLLSRNPSKITKGHTR